MNGGSIRRQEQMTPRQIVAELDKYIVGQQAAKRAVAIALRNRYRRTVAAGGAAGRGGPKEHPDDRPHRRGEDGDRPAAGEAGDAPFIKVEATKFTEVGYVGRDVESMVRDLVETAIRMVKAEQMEGEGQGGPIGRRAACFRSWSRPTIERLQKPPGDAFGPVRALQAPPGCGAERRVQERRSRCGHGCKGRAGGGDRRNRSGGTAPGVRDVCRFRGGGDGHQHAGYVGAVPSAADGSAGCPSGRPGRC